MILSRTLSPRTVTAFSLLGLGSCAQVARPVDSVEVESVTVGDLVEPSVASLTEAELAELSLPYELVEGEPMFTVVPRDGIPALDLPEFVTAEEAASFMRPEETVLGVVGRNGTSKCYSAWQLDSHEIVNDVLDGEPISATW